MKDNLIVVGLIVALGFGLVGTVKQSKTVFVNSNTPTEDSEQVGAASPDFQTKYLGWGGFRTYRGQAGFTAATTTIAAIQCPAATSTVSYAGVVVDLASTTAVKFDLAIASTRYATTTSLIGGNTYAVGGSAQGFFTASTTLGQTGQANTCPPNYWVVLGQRQGITSGSAGTGFAPSGTMNVQFEPI